MKLPSIIHGEIPEKQRFVVLANFINSTGPDILICTDMVARGIDFQDVKHVILCDVPASPVEFLHRVGRTARAGSKGSVTILIGSNDRKNMSRLERYIRT